MLEDSRARLSSFMVRRFASKGGHPAEVLKPLLFADVMKSINEHDPPLLGAECRTRLRCLMVTWLQFPSNINVRWVQRKYSYKHRRGSRRNERDNNNHSRLDPHF